MSAGATKTILVCEPDQSSTGGPCGDGHRAIPTQAYVLSENAAQNFEPIDRQEAGQVFAATFALVFTCFLLGRGVGMVVDMVRNRF